MKNVLCVIALAVFTLTSCVGVAPTPTVTLTLIIAPIETAISTATSEPTATEVPTATPTETLAPKSEMDLNPAYTETVSQKYMGVQIDAQLITDGSLDPELTKVTVPDAIYAEFIAKTVFETWWSKGDTPHTGNYTDADFKSFMALWAKAQQTNDPNDWKAVEVNNIYANDLNDGNGYVQKPYTIWFGYSGDPSQLPTGVKGINSVSVALVDASRMKNISLLSNNQLDQGFAANLDNESLILYSGLALGHWDKSGAAAALGNITGFMIRNYGNGLSGYPSGNDELYRLLLNGGISNALG